MGSFSVLNKEVTLPTYTHYSVKGGKQPDNQSESSGILVSLCMVFPVVTYRYESWTIKKAEHWRVDAFKPRYWRRFLRVPWTAKKSNQSILNEINPEYSLEGLMLMLKLKLQYFGHLMWRANSLEKTLMLRKIESGRRGGRQRMRWLDGITDSMEGVSVNSWSWWWTGRPGVLQSLGLQGVGQLSDWRTTIGIGGGW